MAKPSKDGIRLIARNKKAFHNFFVSDQLEAGVVLVGSEVKSIREGRISLGESYAKFSDDGELYLLDCHIAEYPWANRNNHEPRRPRKLLLHKRELAKLSQEATQAGATLLALSVYLKNGKIKVEVGLGKGKKLYDKRETLKKRDASREMEREAQS